MVELYGSGVETDTISSRHGVGHNRRRSAAVVIGLIAVLGICCVGGGLWINSSNEKPEEVELALGPGMEDVNELRLNRLETEFPCTGGKYYGTDIPFVKRTFSSFDPCAAGSKPRYNLLQESAKMKKGRVPYFLRRSIRKKLRKNRPKGNRCGKGFGNKSCKDIGREGKCCSRFGFCGTGASYCGKGCQNGCW